jgi:hypothetical protein
MACNSAMAVIKYRVSGDATLYDATSGQVNVGVVNGIKSVTIFDDAGTTTDIVALTINGTVGTNPELRVIIAQDGTAWPTQPDIVTIVNTANNLAGLSFSNTALRDASRLVLAINGSVTGPIDAGQVFRLQARTGTTATGDITAHAADGFAGFKACEVVTSSLGSLLGDVLAPNGSIGNIRALNGNIGPAPGTAGPAISAANIGTIQAKRINADITAIGTLNFLSATALDGTGSISGSVSAGTFTGTGASNRPLHRDARGLQRHDQFRHGHGQHYCWWQ